MLFRSYAALEEITPAAYRLPTDGEWSFAAGIGALETGATPKEKDKKLSDVFPWGTTYPPPAGVGNFGDETAKAMFTNWPYIKNYTDGFATAAPVGSFTPNPFGIFDLAGNAQEWCADWYDARATKRVMRGGAWVNCSAKSFLSSARGSVSPERHSVVTGFRCVLDAHQ